VHAILNYTDYAQAIRATMAAGGCNASRSAIIGACLAAQNGKDVIPATWIEKTHRANLTAQLAGELVALRDD